LLADPSRRSGLGKRARERARQYAPERMAAEMAKIYARVMQPQLVTGAA
jgi:glycosyltransferase involved in cell wall biosynthesis